jgi:hypothetical protein
MKYKKIELILILGLLGLNLFAMEDRSDHIVGYQWYEEPERVDLKKDFTLNECVENLKDIVYLLESSYIGFDEMEKRGFDKEAFIKNSDSLFSNEKNISLFKLSDYIYNNLHPYINDCHFKIGCGDTYYYFGNKKVIFLSDTYVIKIKAGYKVIDSTQIPIGTEISISEEKLFKSIHNGKEVFRLGVLASKGERDYTKFLPVSVNDENIRLRCIYFPKTFSSNEFTVVETKNSVYINIPVFDTNAEHFESFRKLGKKYCNKKNLIIDLRQNPGGGDPYFNDFLYDLYSGEENESIFTKFLKDRDSAYKVRQINSPLIEQLLDFVKDSPYGITYLKDSKQVEKKKNKFKTKFQGNLIFLTSKDSASCSEEIILFSKQLFDNVYTVGMNTFGAILYGNVLNYRLKNSGLILTVAQKEWFYDNDLEEGTGILPDYVVTGNFEDTIRFLTKDKEISKKVLYLH